MLLITHFDTLAPLMLSVPMLTLPLVALTLISLSYWMPLDTETTLELLF